MRLARSSPKILIAFSLLLALSSFSVLYAANPGSSKSQAQFDNELYNDLMSPRLESLGDVIDEFEYQQFELMPVLPPGPNGELQQEAGIYAFDPTGFPAEFIKGLVSDYSLGVASCQVWIYEDPGSWNRIIVNSKGEKIASIPPPADYQANWFLLEMYPLLYSGKYSPDMIAFTEATYDPTRLVVGLRLIAKQDIEKYVGIVSLKKAASSPSGGGIKPMMMYNGPPVSNLQFTAIERDTNGIKLTVAYPAAYTNNIDFLTCANLLGDIVWWNLAVTTNINLSTNWIEWTDTEAAGSNVTPRFYLAGNPNYDQDGDGFPDDRERFMYHTDPASSNSFPVNISGTISYQAQYSSGLIWMTAVKSSNSWCMDRSTHISTPGSYTNSGVPNLTNYWFRAFRDVNTNLVLDPWEPWGWYTNAATYVTTNLSGINITLQDPPPNVNGTITYAGSSTGTIYVVAVTTSNSWSTNHSAAILSPGIYNIPNLLETNYWIKAFRDGDGDGVDSWMDAWGMFTNTTITVTNGVHNINITLIDPDSDFDNCPDWWEILLFRLHHELQRCQRPG